MARVSDLAPSWTDRSVYWRATVKRQFIEDGQAFVYLKNRGITEIFRLGVPELKVERLREADIDKYVPCGSGQSNVGVSSRLDLSRSELQDHLKYSRKGQISSKGGSGKLSKSGKRASTNSSKRKNDEIVSHATVKHSKLKCLKRKEQPQHRA